MKNFLFIILLMHSLFFYAQKADQLFFVKENDSILSVKNSDGKIIIPSFRIIWEMTKEKEEIATDIILVQENAIDYKIYDRNGKFLFKPMIFDYSAEFSEGHIAFEENGKQGLANKEGKITIPATYDYMSFLQHGVVEACKDCYFDRSQDPEHPPLVGGTRYWLDKDGNILATEKNTVKASLNSVKYEYNYSNEEKEILIIMEGYKKAIAKKLKLKEEVVSFEIVYNPTFFEPYYYIKLFESSNLYDFRLDSDIMGRFIYDPKSKAVYGFYNETKMYKKNGEEIYERNNLKQPIDKWLKNKKVTSY